MHTINIIHFFYKDSSFNSKKKTGFVLLKKNIALSFVLFLGLAVL